MSSYLKPRYANFLLISESQRIWRVSRNDNIIDIIKTDQWSAWSVLSFFVLSALNY